MLLLLGEEQERPSALATDALGIEVVRDVKRRRSLARHIRCNGRVRNTNASRRVPMTVHLSVRRIGKVQPREARPLPVARVLNETRVFSGPRLHRSMTPNREALLSGDEILAEVMPRGQIWRVLRHGSALTLNR